VGGSRAIKQIEPRSVGGWFDELKAAPDEDGDALGVRVAAECLSEGGFADPRLAPDQHKVPVPTPGRVEVLL
jgi:hypothetical protein